MVFRADALHRLETALEARLCELQLTKHGRELLELKLKLLAHIEKLCKRVLPTCGTSKSVTSTCCGCVEVMAKSHTFEATCALSLHDVV